MRTRSLTLAVAVCLSLSGASCGGSKTGNAGPELEKASDDQRALYVLGVMLGRNIVQWKLSEDDLRYVAAGLSDAAQGKGPRVDVTTYGKRLGEMEKKRASDAASGEKEKGQAYVAKAAQEPGAEKSPSGLVFKSLRDGKGLNPTPADRVVVHYKGTLADGKEFDSSYGRGEPINFALTQVIPCWTEGLQHMRVGGKAQLVCPSDIAYGDAGRPPTIPGGAVLVFEVELLGIVPAGAAPKTGK